MTLLYLLPFKNGLYFKLGIMKDDREFNRVRNHDKSFSVDLENSYLVSSEERTGICLLERELLFLLKPLEELPVEYKYKDGYTEIRHIKDLDYVLNYINDKKKYFDIQIKKGVCYPDKKKYTKVIKVSKSLQYTNPNLLDKSIIDKHLEKVSAYNENLLREFNDIIRLEAKQLSYYKFNKYGVTKLMIFNLQGDKNATYDNVTYFDKYKCCFNASLHPMSFCYSTNLISVGFCKTLNDCGNTIRLEYRFVEQEGDLKQNIDRHLFEYFQRFYEIIESNLAVIKEEDIPNYEPFGFLLPSELSKLNSSRELIDYFGFDLDKEYNGGDHLGYFSIDEYGLLLYTTVYEHEAYIYFVSRAEDEEIGSLLHNEFIGYEARSYYINDIGCRFKVQEFDKISISFGRN